MAAPNLMSVEQIVKGVRVLLLDRFKPYRYADEGVVAALNITLLEARRVRPDLFICKYGIEVPQYEAVSGEEIPIDAQFRLAIEYGTAAHVLMRDQEDVQDERANTFNQNFYNILVGVRQAPLSGTAPQAKQKQAGPAMPGMEG